jgi:RNA polymerase sigma-70 factor, ECF subfamily
VVVTSDTATLERGRTENERVRDLVDRAQRGERSALEDLYLLYFDRIYSYLHMSVGSRHDAEDLTTQTFLRMLEAIGRFEWRSAPFSAWLFRIAHNLAMDHFRATRRWQPEEEISEAVLGEETSAEEQALASLGDTSMLKLIERLSPDQRQVLTLKFVFRFSNSETASILDKTDGAVKSLQHRALASLQRHARR